MTHPQIALWASAAEAFDGRHRLVTAEHHSMATPCGDYDVAALIDHAVGTQIAFARFFGGSPADDSTWGEARAAMAAALEDPSRIDGTHDHPAFGEIDREQLLAIATNDLLIHTWDLAKAIGANEDLPARNLQPAIDGLNAFPAGAKAALFAEPIPVAANAALQTAMLAAAGRSDS